jgi:2-dehydropantoate 2-reductase
MLWEKLVAAISNSLSGALLIPVSELLGSKAAHDVLDAARAEAVAVAKALGVALDGDGLLDRLRRAGSGSVGGTVGSTYQSLMSGRRPEVDDISGAIVELAARVGVPTPVNDLLARLVEARLEVGGIGA